jgi:hypothetical protein
MDLLNYSTLTLLRPVAAYPDIRRIGLYLDDNEESLRSYYLTSNRYFNNSHPLLRLVNRFYEYFGDTPEQTYRNVFFNLTEINLVLGLVGINSRQLHQPLFCGKDYLVSNSSTWKVAIPDDAWIGGRLVNWREQKAICCYYHEETSMQPVLFSADTVDELRTSISYIDLPLLAVQLQEWTKLQQAKELADNLQHFIIEFIYLALYRSFLNVSFFNRLQYALVLGRDVTVDSNSFTLRPNPPFLYKNVDSEVNRVVKNIATTLSKLPKWDVSRFLCNVPLPYATDARALLPPLSEIYPDAIQWVEMTLQMHLYKRMQYLSKMLYSDVTQGMVDAKINLKLTKTRITNLTRHLEEDVQSWTINTLTPGIES